MKNAILIPVAAAFSISLCQCKKATEIAADSPPSDTADLRQDPLYQADLPLLAPQIGDVWKYHVTVLNPKDARTGQPVRAEFERTRTYIGEISVGDDSFQAFEVQSGTSPIVRELVHITDDRILIAGQGRRGPNGETLQPVLLEKPVPFFNAGLHGGEGSPVTVFADDESLWRSTRAIGRETLTVPAGTFTQAVRLQMLGQDQEISLQRTYWFAPGCGILKEDTLRESKGVTLFRETQELTELPASLRNRMDPAPAMPATSP
ncbi:hypothetical protein HNR46_001961 [Haloferula luteola]|uniref:Uncharacterized protein n=1 Tax=Haloferula luteola TaxID=595692 RepID=A0A840V146_9BACT|nr:hypothetical protein [Haloferula luteola]MBB5351722.1 hypothetical protein [Haloferula luteola]